MDEEFLNLQKSSGKYIKYSFSNILLSTLLCRKQEEKNCLKVFKCSRGVKKGRLIYCMYIYNYICQIVLSKATYKLGTNQSSAYKHVEEFCLCVCVYVYVFTTVTLRSFLVFHQHFFLIVISKISNKLLIKVLCASM